MNLFVAVALGGAAGACLRYAIVLLVGPENQGFPYATLIANVIGCVAIGVLLFLIDQREFLNAHWRVFLVTGILGSLTTFSTFSYESYTLWMSGERSLAVAAVSVNVVVGIAAVACGSVQIVLTFQATLVFQKALGLILRIYGAALTHMPDCTVLPPAAPPAT